MKKQIVKGWAYPCDKHKFIYVDTFNVWGSTQEVKVFNIDLPVRKNDLIHFRDECVCGKNCKPISVTVTVEPEVNE